MNISILCRSRKYRPNLRQLGRSSVLCLLSIVFLVTSSGAGRVFAGNIPCPTGMSNLDCQAINYGWTDWIPDGGCNTGAGTLPTLVGNDNIQKVFNFFVSNGGLTGIQAAGILGNLLQESGDHLDPTAGSLTPGVGYGIAQWTTADRQAALVAYAKAQGTDPSDFATQLGFLWKELTTSYSGVLTSLKTATNVADATNIFEGPDNLAGQPVAPIDEEPRSGGFENSGTPIMVNRIAYANQVLKLYGGNASSGSTATTSGTATGCATAVTCAPTTGSTPADNKAGTVNTVSTGTLSTVRQNVVCLAQQELALWESQPGYPTPAYSATGYLKYSDGVAEEWCADFVSWIYKQAGYPFTGGSSGGWRLPGVAGIYALGNKEGSFHWHSESSNYVPKPGDIAIHYDATQKNPYVHTNIFISSTAGSSIYIGGDQGSGPYPGGSNVSIETAGGYYNDGIIGYVTPD